MAAARAEGDRSQVQGNSLITTEKERLNSVFANGNGKPGNGVLTSESYLPAKAVREFPVAQSSSHLQAPSQHVPGMVMQAGQTPQYASAGYGPPPRMYHPAYGPPGQLQYPSQQHPTAAARPAHPYPAPQVDPGRGPPVGAWDPQRAPLHSGYPAAARPQPMRPTAAAQSHPGRPPHQLPGQQQQLPRSPLPPSPSSHQQQQQQQPLSPHGIQPPQSPQPPQQQAPQQPPQQVQQAPQQQPPVHQQQQQQQSEGGAVNKELGPSDTSVGGGGGGGGERDLTSPRPTRPVPTPPPGAVRPPLQTTQHTMSSAVGPRPGGGPGPDGVAQRLMAGPQQHPYPPPPGATPLVHKPGYMTPHGGYRGEPAPPPNMQFAPMYGSPYGRAVPAPAPTPGSQQHYPYPGHQPWPGAPPASGGKPGSQPHQPAPPGVARAPVSPHFLRHQMAQKLQYNTASPPMPPPARPSSQGSDASQPTAEPAPALLGPDGAPLDECSQHSTLSNASANSEERSRSPKRRDGPGAGSQPPTPLSGLASPGGAEHEMPAMSSVASPGAASNTSGSNTGWSRSPGTKAESLGRLFEMDDNPARREWVNRLLTFMEERGTPILQCPTVSKQPLDLFKLYHYTKERGGFVEVSTAKTWKDVAALIGIGSSSSGAYTLRKHYMKSLLPFECHFDRGGQDPAPIIAKWETKASRRSKAPASPGPQDSFSNPASMDGFPPGCAAGYPRSEYNGTGGPAMPPQGYPGHGYPGQPAPGQPGYGQYPPGQPRPGQEYPPHSQHQQYLQQYPNRNYPSGPVPPGGAAASVPEYRYPGPPPGPTTYGARPLYPGGPPAPQRTPPPPAGGSTSPAGTPPPPQPPPAGYSGPPGTGEYPPPATAAPAADQYPPTRPGGAAFGSQLARQLSAPPGAPRPGHIMSGSGVGAAPTLSRQLAAPPGHPQAMRPPYSHAPVSASPPSPYGAAAGPAGPRRPPPPPAGALPYTGPAQQHLSQPPPQTQEQQQQYGWRGGANTQLQTGGQWGQRYPAPAPAAQWSAASQPGPRPAARAARPQPPAKTVPAAYMRPAFPPDSVEATLPVLARRRRGTRADLGAVDGWRLTLALRSGQLAESRWALDVLQILSYDDSAVAWLDLAHMPGLLAALLQHFRTSLAAMFARRPAVGQWYEGSGDAEDEPEPDLGSVRPADAGDKRRVLSGRDYSRVTRCGRSVEVVDCESAILVSDRRRAWEADVLGVDSAWDHVLTHMKVESGRVPYQRRLVDGKVTEPEPVVVKQESDSEERMETDEESAVKPPSDERLAGFHAPDFFLERLKRSAPMVKDSMGVSDMGEGGMDDGSAVTVKTEQPETAAGDCQAEQVTVKCDPDSSDVKGEDMVNGVPSPTEKDVVPKKEPEKTSKVSCLEIRDPSGSLKRPRPEDEEEECQQRDESSLYLTSETQENISARCLAACTVLRNLSFVPGNETELSREPAVLSLLGDLLQLHHTHPARAAGRHSNYDRDEDADLREPCPALAGDEWWSPQLPALHEAALVTLTNISGQLRLGGYSDAVVRPLLDGLLHWLQCPAAYAADPLPTAAGSACPQLLALEALCRLCVHPENVDLLLATPPGWRWERICRLAAGWSASAEHQVRREMSLTLLHALAGVDERIARLLAVRTPGFIATLVRFVEAAEQSALSVASAQGVNALRDNPDLMGTSLDVLGRAAALLLSLARLPDSGPPLRRCEHRLLALVTSQILDQRVAATLSQVLYLLSEPPAS